MTTERLSIFPLTGALLFPGLQLPLRIFEPRYCAMVSDALARDQRIAMIQPQASHDGAPLFQIGCVGKITEFEMLDDGRYNLVLQGLARFRMVRELTVATPFRQIEAEIMTEVEHPAISAIERAGFEREARSFATAQGYAVDWDSVGKLDDAALVNGVSQIVPFDAAAKQALLEAVGLAERCELLIQLMQFFGRRDRDDGRVTLQ